MATDIITQQIQELSISASPSGAALTGSAAYNILCNGEYLVLPATANLVDFYNDQQKKPLECMLNSLFTFQFGVREVYIGRTYGDLGDPFNGLINRYGAAHRDRGYSCLAILHASKQDCSDLADELFRAARDCTAMPAIADRESRKAPSIAQQHDFQVVYAAFKLIDGKAFQEMSHTAQLLLDYFSHNSRTRVPERSLRQLYSFIVSCYGGGAIFLEHAIVMSALPACRDWLRVLSPSHVEPPPSQAVRVTSGLISNEMTVFRTYMRACVLCGDITCVFGRTDGLITSTWQLARFVAAKRSVPIYTLRLGFQEKADGKVCSLPHPGVFIVRPGHRLGLQKLEPDGSISSKMTKIWD
eukprot:TRINITY_DN5745_c0_g2_i1.p1 TRINITY_DN5745_c0_g2~~TRINITY_DN5745_c0_g2_i1.p1  ORF type:complete len:356 (+),score=50.42 TRINITY_DN5745_c0_g2_i1:173-1240(+)